MLKTGDIVSIDTGVVLDGFYGDSAITVPVGGGLTPQLEKLIEVTRDSLYKGIEAVRIGNTIGDVGAAVQQVVEANGFSVVREFVGHGIGTKLHEDPQVPNYGTPGSGPKLRDGMATRFREVPPEYRRPRHCLRRTTTAEARNRTFKEVDSAWWIVDSRGQL